jgi:hypothetical protein
LTRGAADQLLHGESHPGNLLSARDGRKRRDQVTVPPMTRAIDCRQR